jgi:hypothetical protein
MYGVNPDVEMDIKHINKFGHNEFGKSRWNRFTLDEKTTKIKEIMKKLDIQDNLELTGFNYFQKQFNNILDTGSQYTFLMNHLMFKCSQLLEEYKKENSIDYYDKFLEVYNQVIVANKKYNRHSGLDTFYYYLTKFIELHKDPHLIISIDALNNTKEEHIEHLEWAQLHCKKWKHKYGKEFKLLKEQEIIITNALNKYYASNINSQEKPIATLLSRFKKLFANGYNITKELIIKLFTNDDMLNKQPEEIIQIIDDMVAKGLITKEQQCDMVYNLLRKIYTIYNNEPNAIEYMKMGQRRYIYFADMFWTKQIMLSNYSNEFSNLGMMMKAISIKYLNFNSLNKIQYVWDMEELFTNSKKTLECYYVSLF